jgi:hypothetical protein
MPRTQNYGQAPADSGDTAQPHEYPASKAAANPRPPPDSKPRSMLDAIRGLFRAAVAAVTRRSPNPSPKPRRQQRGETDKGAVAAHGTMLHRFVKTGAAARGRYAALQPVQEAEEPASTYDRVALYLSDTLDWFNLWQDNAGYDHWLDDHSLDDELSANQNQIFPQP